MQPLQTLCVSNPGATSLPIAHSTRDGAICSGAQRIPASSDPAVKDLEIAPGHVVGLHKGNYYVLGPGTGNRPQQFNPQQGIPNVVKQRIGVAQGIASIIGPLASIGTNIFSTVQRTELAKEQLKRGGAGGGMDPAMMAMMMSQQQRPRSNTGLIVGVAAVAIIAVVGFMLMKKPAQ